MVKKPFILRSIDAVNAVVGIHHRPRLCFLDGNFKSGQIDFAQGSLVHHFIDGHSVSLLAVSGKVLERSADTLGLDALNQRCGALTRQIRVLGEILEVSAAGR